MSDINKPRNNDGKGRSGNRTWIDAVGSNWIPLLILGAFVVVPVAGVISGADDSGVTEEFNAIVEKVEDLDKGETTIVTIDGKDYRVTLPGPKLAP